MFMGQFIGYNQPNIATKKSKNKDCIHGIIIAHNHRMSRSENENSHVPA
jgi:hypothetical protein